MRVPQNKLYFFSTVTVQILYFIIVFKIQGADHAIGPLLLYLVVSLELFSNRFRKEDHMSSVDLLIGIYGISMLYKSLV